MVYNIEDETDKTAKERHMVLKQIKILKATFPQELSERTGLPYEMVDAIINFYLMKGHIERIPIHPDIVDPRLQSRMSELHARGMLGFNDFKRKKWVGFKLWWLPEWLKKPDNKQKVLVEQLA